MTRILAAVAACLLFIAPAFAQDCMKWEDGQANAASYVASSGDRVAAVLLTPEESEATWAAMFPGSAVDAPHRLGIHIIASVADKAFVAGFDEAGCLTGSSPVPFGIVIDAMTAADVQSEFVNVEPGEGA